MKEYSDNERENDKAEKIMRRRNTMWRMAEEAQLRRKKESDQGAGALQISSPGDAQEHEADAVAKKVTSGQKAAITNSAAASPLQAKSGDNALTATPELQNTLDSSKGGGQALEDKTQSDLGSKMGADLSGVKIHTDQKAHNMAEGINAKAFTHGQDIYFGQGHYNPQSTDGKELLAHELAHTVQQKNGISRKIYRSMKFEFQTQNYVWAVKNSGDPDPLLLPRKYGASSPDMSTSIENGDLPAYLSVGKSGVAARSVGDVVYVKAEGHSTMEKARTSNMVPAKGPQFDETQPAQFVIKIKVKNSARYLGSGAVPKAEDLEPLGKEEQKIKKGINSGTYEYMYYDADTYDEGKDAVNTQLDVHRDKQGVFRKGTVKLMVEKKAEYSADKAAQFVKDYAFQKPVSENDILGQPVSEGQLKLINETDNSKVPDMKDAYNPNTFEFNYSSDGKPLEVHLDENGTFAKGHVKLMKVGSKPGKGIDAEKEAQYIETYKVTIDPAGKTSYFDPATEEIKKVNIEPLGERIDYSDAVKYPGMQDKYNAGTYEKKYYLSTSVQGNVPVKGAAPMPVHEAPDGGLVPGYVKFMKQKTLKKDKEQTAIELQSERRGFLEFETPKWFDNWPELKMRIQDAVDMTQAISASTLVTDPAILAGIEKNKDKAEGKETIKPTVKVVEWPEKDFSTLTLKNLKKDGRRLVVQIVDENWFATIQSSEAIAMNNYQSLLEENEESGLVGVVEKHTNNIYTKAMGIAKAKEPGLNDNLFVNLKGFLMSVVYYIYRGERSDQRGKPAKEAFRIMARTNFASMYRELLSEEEKNVFKIMVGKAPNASDNLILLEYSDKDPQNPSVLGSWGQGVNLQMYGSDHFFKNGYGSSNNDPGPTRQEWLQSIITAGSTPEGKDLLSTKSTTENLGGAMGNRDVETKPGERDYMQAQFEVRGTTPPGREIQPASNWVAYIKGVFDSAARRSADKPDDPGTPGINEASKTKLKK